MKKKKIAKYGIIKDVLYEWYIKCCQAGIYLDGAMLQEEALKIKTEVNDSNLGTLKHLMDGQNTSKNVLV